MLYTCLSLLILLICFTAYLLNQQKSREAQRLENKINRINFLAQSVNEQALIDVDYSKVEVNCEALFEDEDVVGITLTDIYDNVKVDLKDKNDTDTTLHITKNLVINKPNSNTKLAKINITYTESKIKRNLAALRNNMISLIAGMIALISLIFFGISNIISRPVNSIISSLQKIDNGDLTHRMSLTNNDEFKQIQDHFNKMVGSIKDKKDQLEEINHQLVAEIDERQRTMQILSNIISNIPYSVFWKNTALEYTGCNENFQQDQQKTQEQIVGKTDLQLASTEKLAKFHQNIDRQVIDSKQAVIELEHAELRSGQEVIYSTSRVPLYNENREVIGLLGIYADITERKHKEQELKSAKEAAEAANKAKSEFLANMSHEIRTPMNGIMGMAEILSHTEMDEDQKKYVGLIKTSTDSLLQIINDILDISRIEAGRIDFNDAEFNLAVMVEKVIDTFSVTAHDKSLELLYHIAPDVNIELHGDGDRLKQVLNNVIGNAVKFTDEGQVYVNISKLEQNEKTCTLQFTVKDTGIGIPKEKLDAVFDSFTQVDSSYSRRFGGTGLGLAISKRLIEMMEGSIRVESELGKGSTFYFTIPFPYKKEAYIEQPKLPASLQKLKVLVVDDNESSKDLLQKILKNMNCLVDAVTSASQGLELLQNAKQAPYSVLFTDLTMPNKDGIDLIAEATEQNTLANTAIVLMISSTDAKNAKEKLDKGKKLNVQKHLVKPLKNIEIQQMLVQLMKQQQSQRKLIKTDYTEQQKPVTTIVRDKPLKVLVAEDHILIQNITKMMLEKRGYQVVTVSNGQEAIDAFDNSFDLIIMDIQMPVVDGVTATNEIRARESGKKIPIIALTAHAQSGDKERFLESGMDDYVSKPYKADDFYKVLDKHIGQPA